MAEACSRRQFMKRTAWTAAGVSLGAGALSAKSYSRVMGANDRVHFGVIGLHGRGRVLMESISADPHGRVSHLCDVDTRELDKASLWMKEEMGMKPVLKKDFRKLLESKEVDAIAVATPEHWHAPMALMGLQAGKHVYVEKPCSHNPAEGELLVAAQRKYQPLIQMGNQQRSSPHTVEAIQKIREGVIGTPYFGKAWYSNNRTSIGIGQRVPVPDELDWELWQGPAPRRPYKDNIHPYNWHWFWHWGTGETLNNATHEVDVCLWALGLESFPDVISASGGRYHFDDDWEFYDTLITSFEYDGKMITWEGKSCNDMQYYGRGRGATIHGTEGTVLIDRNGYEIYDNDDALIFSFVKLETDATTGIGGGGSLTNAHVHNLIEAIRTGETLHSPIQEGNVSVTMLQLSNIAWKVGHVLELDSETGHIQNDKLAMEMLWSREYEPGWEPKI